MLIHASRAPWIALHQKLLEIGDLSFQMANREVHAILNKSGISALDQKNIYIAVAASEGISAAKAVAYCERTLGQSKYIELIKKHALAKIAQI